jgi:hypothetical protein
LFLVRPAGRNPDINACRVNRVTRSQRARIPRPPTRPVERLRRGRRSCRESCGMAKNQIKEEQSLLRWRDGVQPFAAQGNRCWPPTRAARSPGERAGTGEAEKSLIGISSKAAKCRSLGHLTIRAERYGCQVVWFSKRRCRQSHRWRRHTSPVRGLGR